MSNYLRAAMFEHGFWLQVLGDHARFIYGSLNPKEKTKIAQAEKFRQVFDALLAQARQLRTKEEAVRLAEEAKSASEKLRNYKLTIIREQLENRVSIHLTPTFINHMVNELEEYLRVVEYLRNGQKPPVFHELHHHLVWLLDAAGHAGAINDQLDKTEQQLKKKSKQFTKHFDAFYLKAVEFSGYLRTNLTDFPALRRMNRDVQVEIGMFQLFLNELLEMDLSAEVLNTFPSLMADHMFREECYYLIKLAESSQNSPPNCNPAKPRLGDK